MEHQLSFADLIDITHDYSVSDLSEFVHDMSKSGVLFPEYTTHGIGRCGVYVFDYTTWRYAFVDEPFAEIAERSAAYILDNGLSPKEKIWYEPDQEIFREKILTQNLQYFEKVPAELRGNYLISCNYRNKRRDGGFKNILQRSFVIRSTESGVPLAVIGFISDVSEISVSNRLFHSIRNISPSKMGPPDYQDLFYSFEGDKRFSRRQIEILLHLADGLTEKQIADKLRISIKTVENHKLNMRMLSNTKNTPQLIKYAALNGYF